MKKNSFWDTFWANIYNYKKFQGVVIIVILLVLIAIYIGKAHIEA